MEKLGVWNEYGKLRRVLVGGFERVEVAGLKAILKDEGVEYQTCPFIWSRDERVVVGKTAIDRVVNRDPIINGVPTKTGIPWDFVVPQDEQFPDGGDIILHNGTIFCGTNKRRKDRIKCLEKQFGKEWNIEPIEITQDIYGEEIVHLDCVFNPIAADEALVCPSGMTTDSERKLEKAFSNIITVSGEEQSELGVNVLSLGGKVLVAQARHRRINHELASRGYRVRTTGFDAHASHGGAFRCITSPRLRDAD